MTAYRPLLFLAALAAIALAAGCGRSPAPAATAALPPLAVEAVPVQFSTESVPVEVTGLLSRRAEALLSFKTGGIIASVAVRSGDTVKAGQVLAALRLDEIDARVAQATTAVEKARRDLARVQALHADRVATLENLQDARSGLELAEAGLRAAQFNREHSVITAPADGRILRRMAEPNELVESGRPVLDFAADGEGWIVRAGVPERAILLLHPGDRAAVAIDGDPEVPATITHIAETTDPATRTVEVELQPVAPLAAGQRSGFVVNVRLWSRPVAPRPVVPLAALVEGKERRGHVFIVSADGARARRVPVEIEAIAGGLVYLRTELAAGSRVVTTGAEFLTDSRAITAAQP